jgi:hypothetical protein
LSSGNLVEQDNLRIMQRAGPMGGFKRSRRSFAALHEWHYKEQAEGLLRRGLSVENVRDRGDLVEMLEALLEERGRSKEFAEVRRTDIAEVESVEIGGRVVKLKTNFDFGEKGLPLDELPLFMAQQRRRHERMIERFENRNKGRNDPFHYGSGKKYKKCCGG